MDRTGGGVKVQTVPKTNITFPWQHHSLLQTRQCPPGKKHLGIVYVLVHVAQAVVSLAPGCVGVSLSIAPGCVFQ